MDFLIIYENKKKVSDESLGGLRAARGQLQQQFYRVLGPDSNLHFSFQEFPKNSVAGLEQLGDVSLPRPFSLMKLSYSRRMPIDITTCLDRNLTKN